MTQIAPYQLLSIPNNLVYIALIISHVVQLSVRKLLLYIENYSLCMELIFIKTCRNKAFNLQTFDIYAIKVSYQEVQIHHSYSSSAC